MINIDFLTLKAFLTENIDFLVGAKIQKIQQPSRRDFIFILKNNYDIRKLYININPSVYHIAFMSKENEENRFIKIPKQPPMFCMLLRKYLDNCRISDACIVENERILEFHFEACNEFTGKKLLCLAVELMGKHSNIVLYDKETSIILGCAHNIGTEKSRYRELKGGLKYIYPPKQNGVVLSNELKLQFHGLSNEQIQYYLDTDIYRPAIDCDRYTLFSELLENPVMKSSVNEMLDTYYAEFQKQITIDSSKHKLYAVVNNKIKKNNNSIIKIKNLLSKRNDVEKYKLYGELLTSNLYMKANYIKEVELFDYKTNSNIIIPLDESKSMKDNAQHYFKLYTKGKMTREKSHDILAELEIEKEYYENILYSIDNAKDISDFDDIEYELGIVEKDKKKINKINIAKININGFDVFIGKNNKQNDYIISKLAKDDDYWFHTKLCAGSHVLLKIIDKEPDASVIYECAKLAREYSSAKQPSKIGVVYTKRKYIKKPPSAPLGYVTYQNEKEILI